jgi:hypothetical protein
VGTKGSGLQGRLEASFAHAQRDHDQPFVMGRVCERKGSEVVARFSRGWVRQGKISMLPSPEFVVGTICAEPERHRIPSDSLSIHESHQIFSHSFSLA